MFEAAASLRPEKAQLCGVLIVETLEIELQQTRGVPVLDCLHFRVGDWPKFVSALAVPRGRGASSDGEHGRSGGARRRD